MKLKTVTLLVLSLLTCGAMAEGRHDHKHGQHRQEQYQRNSYRPEYRRDSYRPEYRTTNTTVVVQPRYERPWYNPWARPVVVQPRPVYVAPRRTVVVAPRPWYVVIWPW